MIISSRKRATRKGRPFCIAGARKGVGCMADRLTDKDRRFADEYIIDFDAKHAAIRAGYAESTARNAAAWKMPRQRVQPSEGPKPHRIIFRRSFTGITRIIPPET